MTVADFLKILESVPDDAPVYMETTTDHIQDIDTICIEYFPMDNAYTVTLKI